MDKMPKPIEKSLTLSSGGRHSVKGLELEVVAGALSLVLAATAQALNRDIIIWNVMICGMAGIFGTFAFLNVSKFEVNVERFVAILIGAGMASVFGPLVSNAAGYYLPWVGQVNYFVDAASGALVGIISTPILAFARNPGPLIMMLVSALTPWGKKKDN